MVAATVLFGLGRLTGQSVHSSRRFIRTFSSVPSVLDTINSSPVAVYSKTTCGFCSRVKLHFRDLGITPAVVEINKAEHGLDFHKELIGLTGQRTVPYVFVHGEFIGGHDDTVAIPDEELIEMVNAGDS